MLTETFHEFMLCNLLAFIPLHPCATQLMVKKSATMNPAISLIYQVQHENLSISHHTFKKPVHKIFNSKIIKTRVFLDYSTNIKKISCKKCVFKLVSRSSSLFLIWNLDISMWWSACDFSKFFQRKYLIE